MSDTPSQPGGAEGGKPLHTGARSGLNYLRRRLKVGDKVLGEDYDRILKHARTVLESPQCSDRDKIAASKLIFEMERQTLDVAKLVDEVDAPRDVNVNHTVKAYEGFDPTKVGGAGG